MGFLGNGKVYIFKLILRGWVNKQGVNLNRWTNTIAPKNQTKYIGESVKNSLIYLPMNKHFGEVTLGKD